MTKHKMSGTRLYDIWRDMRHRCDCKGMKNYQYYGGRGIRYCDDWNSFERFYEWAISNGYSEKLTLDRIDNDGNYEPSNCRWVDKSVQAANRNNTGKTEYIGVSLHSNGSCYITQIRYKRKVLFSYSNPSKNECAKARNDYIVKNNLPHKLNIIDDSLEDIRTRKKEYIYYAIDKNTKTVLFDNRIKQLASKVNLSVYFIQQCIKGERKSRQYIFRKELANDINRG